MMKNVCSSLVFLLLFCSVCYCCFLFVVAISVCFCFCFCSLGIEGGGCETSVCKKWKAFWISVF